MATVNYLYRSKKEIASLTIRLLYRYTNRDFVLSGKTNIAVSKDYWNKQHKKRLRDIELKNQQNEINDELNKLELFILKNFELVKNKSNLNKQWLNDQLHHYYNPNQTTALIPDNLVSFIDYYIEQHKDRVAPQTVSKYRTIQRKLHRMELHQGYTIFFKDINDDFKNDFARFYTAEKYSKNTAQRELNIVKTFCKYAKRKGILVHTEADFIKLQKKEVPKIYLSFDELEKIEATHCIHDYLENAKDWLIISCFTGQRISDFMRFNKSMIREENGKLLIEFKQRKTNKLMTIPILPKVKEILDKRNGDFPRKISHQRYNDYIKEVCKLAGILEITEGKKQLNISKEKEKIIMRNVSGSYPKYELVTSHIGRRSFATNYYGTIPTTFLIYITGHSSENTFLGYIGKSNKDLAIEILNYFK